MMCAYSQTCIRASVSELRKYFNDVHFYTDVYIRANGWRLRAHMRTPARARRYSGSSTASSSKPAVS